jgi:hypothetical protein
MPNADLKFEEMTFQVNCGPASISGHYPDIAPIMMADGSVHQISNDLHPSKVRNLIQPADGNAVGF